MSTAAKVAWALFGLVVVFTLVVVLLSQTTTHFGSRPLRKVA